MQSQDAVIKALDKAGSRGLSSATLAESVGIGRRPVDWPSKNCEQADW